MPVPKIDNKIVLTDGTNYFEPYVTTDAELSAGSANPIQNQAVTAALEGKQGTLTAGTNITISGSTISAEVPDNVLRYVELSE